MRCHVVILFSAPVPPTPAPHLPPRMQLLFCGTCVTNCTKMSFLDSGCTNMLHARLQTCYYLDTHCTSSLCSVYYSKPSILFYLQARLLVDCYVQMSPGSSVLGHHIFNEHKLITNEHRFIKNYGLRSQDVFTHVPRRQIQAAEMTPWLGSPSFEKLGRCSDWNRYSSALRRAI